MKKLIPYLNFNGQCREALGFYKQCFGEGVDLSIMTFADAPAEEGNFGSDEHKDAVMHAEFKADGLFFMATDGQPGNPFVQGNNVHLSMQLEDLQEQAELFAKLSAGGNVTMPLQDTFWKARFGMFTDKFGIHWMMNVPQH